MRISPKILGLNVGVFETVDPTKTSKQANDTAAKGLLSNLRQRYHETC